MHNRYPGGPVLGREQSIQSNAVMGCGRASLNGVSEEPLTPPTPEGPPRTDAVSYRPIFFIEK